MKAFSCALALCAAGAWASEPVRIGLVRGPGAAPLYIAISSGAFAAESLEPQLKYFDSDEAVSKAMAAGQLDAGLAALNAPFYASAATNGFKIIASMTSDQTGFPGYAFLIGKKANKPAFAARDLVNKRIGMPVAGSGAWYGMHSAELRFELDQNAIKLTAFKSHAAELGALRLGTIDAALLTFSRALSAKHKDESLLPLSDLVQWQTAVVFTKAQRPLLERFMRAYQKGTAGYQLNFLHYDDGGDFIPGPRHDEYEAVIVKESHVPAAFLEKTKTYCDRRANLDAADVMRQVRFWQAEGRLGKDVDPAALLDLSFIGEEVTPK